MSELSDAVAVMYEQMTQDEKRRLAGKLYVDVSDDSLFLAGRLVQVCKKNDRFPGQEIGDTIALSIHAQLPRLKEVDTAIDVIRELLDFFGLSAGDL